MQTSGEIAKPLRIPRGAQIAAEDSQTFFAVSLLFGTTGKDKKNKFKLYEDGP